MIQKNGYFTDAVFPVYRCIFFLQYNHLSGFNGNSPLADTACSRGQHRYDCHFMVRLQTRQYNISLCSH